MPHRNFLNDELSPSNYDSLLVGWAQLDLEDDIIFSVGESQYTTVGADARQAIIEDHGWTISDGGKKQ